jgi:hypothetical protein
MMNAYWTRLHDDTYDLRDDAEVEASIARSRRRLFTPDGVAEIEAEEAIERRYAELVASRVLAKFLAGREG